MSQRRGAPGWQPATASAPAADDPCDRAAALPEMAACDPNVAARAERARTDTDARHTGDQVDRPTLSMRTSWLRTLYDLAGWVHPGWLERYGIEAGWPPRLVNHMLVSALPVPVPLTDHSWPSGANTLSRVWYALPAIGYLMGVRCLRDTILARNALTKTPVVARGFLMVPFVPLNGLHAQVDTDRETHYAHAQPAAETALLEEQIQRWGLACLRAAFAHGSPCLHERLALHFAPPVAAGRPAGARAFPVSARACRALFELAVAYHEATYDAKTDSAAA